MELFDYEEAKKQLKLRIFEKTGIALSDEDPFLIGLLPVQEYMQEVHDTIMEAIDRASERYADQAAKLQEQQQRMSADFEAQHEKKHKQLLQAVQKEIQATLQQSMEQMIEEWVKRVALPWRRQQQWQLRALWLVIVLLLIPAVLQCVSLFL